jgi:hypothetical protein
MKFDHVRNSKETTQLLGYLACLTISGGIASVFGVSWLLGFAIVMVIYRGWEKKHPFLSGRLQALTIATFCLLSLAGNYSAYCDGVSAGFDAAGKVGIRPGEPVTLQRNASKADPSTIESPVRHG